MPGASRVSVTRAQQSSKPLSTNPTTRIGAVGVTERGPIGVARVLSSIVDFEREFGNPTLNAPDMYLQLKALFDEAGDGSGAEVWCTRVVHCSDPNNLATKTSAAATLMLVTSAASATSGTETSATGPFVTANGSTLIVKVDGGGNQTFTISATAASRTSATGPYTLANGQTLTGSIDGVAFPTKTFATSEFNAIAAATATEVVAALNQHFAQNSVGASASVVANAVKITSNRLGTGSSVNISGGTANVALAFTTGATAGTGNVSNAFAVTATEFATILAGLTGGVASAALGALTLTSSTTGTGSSVQVVNTSTLTAALGFDNAIHAGHAAGAQNTIRIDGRTDGSYANALSIQVANASNGQADHFNLNVLKAGVIIEQFPSVNLSSSSANYVVTRVNTGSNGQVASRLVSATNMASTLPSPTNLPAPGTTGPLTGGGDGLVGLADADFTGGVSSNGRTGMRSLDLVDDVALLICPGGTTVGIHNGQVTYCESTRKGLCFAILDTPPSLSADGMVTYVSSTALLKGLSEMAAAYWPRVYHDNPNTSVFGTAATVLTGPAGAVAGLCARMDASKEGGAFEHPASIEKGFLRTVRALETDEVKDDDVRGRVFDALVNPIMVKTGVTPYVDGARTLKDTGPFPTVGESRGVLFLQLVIARALDPKRNQNLRPRFYNEIKLKVTPFMERLTSKECFASNVNAEAWFFDIGKALNTSAVQNAKTAEARLGVATSKPGEFINVIIAPFSAAA